MNPQVLGSSADVQWEVPKEKEAVITNRSNQHAPFGDLSHYPTLTRAQEIELANLSIAGREAEAQLAEAKANGTKLAPRDSQALKRSVAKGKEARDYFVACNLKLAISVVGKKNVRSELKQDLYQEAAMGVMTAVEKFDPTKGFKFSTYATWWIKQSVQRSLQKHSRTIALPEDVDAEVRRLHNFQIDYYTEHGCEATVAELAALMNITADRVRKLRVWSEYTGSLDEKFRNDDGDGASIGDVYVDSSAVDFTDLVDTRLLAEEVANELAQTVSQDEQVIIAERLGLTDGQSKSLDAVAKQKNLTRSQARTLESNALKAVRATKKVRDLGSGY